MRIRFICAAIAISIGVSSAYAGPTLFDWEYYGANNPDVVAVYGNTKEAMLAHYTAYGWKEGRKGYEADTKPTRMKETAASKGFDWEYYGANNPDVVAVYGNTEAALTAHYTAYGFAEGRKREQGDIPWKTRKQNDWAKHISKFDWEYYGANNPDVVAVYGNTEAALTAHYTAHGFAEGRSPNKENTNTDNSLLDTLYITKYDLDDEINNLSEVAIKVYVEYHKASRNGFQDKAEFEEAAAKIKAAEKKAAEKQAAIDDAFSVFDITAEEAAAKIKAAKEKAAEKQAAIDDAFSVFDITAKEAAAKIKAAEDEAEEQETKEDSSYILTNESLMEMLGPLLKKYPQLADIIANFKNIKIEKLTDVKQYKIITKGGIVKTIHCNPCTWHSATLQGLRIGRDLGMPLDIFNAIYNAINDEFGGESFINKSDMRKLIISIWKNLENVMAKAMADPNFDIANAMTKEQIQRNQSQAGSIDNSGGSAGGHDHHHEEGHHEEPM